MKNSKEIGIHENLDKGSSRFFFITAIVISNLFVFVLTNAPKDIKTNNIPVLKDYSEVIVSLDLKTPFKEGKKINIKDSNHNIFRNIYFMKRIPPESNMGFEDKEYFVIYIPNKDLFYITQSNGLTALPGHISSSPLQPTVAKRTHYEIDY